MRRCSHSEEGAFCMCHGATNTGIEPQSATLYLCVQRLCQSRLVQGWMSRLQHFQLTGIVVDANHAMADFCYTPAGYQTHIARSDHDDVHWLLLDNVAHKRPAN